MRVLLDACVPRRLAGELPGHEVRTAPAMGWADLDDGPLLNAMAGRFEVLVTVDKNLSKQQNLEQRPFAVVVLRAKTNRLVDLRPLAPALRAAITELRTTGTAMPELFFKGKEYVYNHHLTVPYRPLVPDKKKSIGPADLGGNLIIHGDNLHALKSLLPPSPRSMAACAAAMTWSGVGKLDHQENLAGIHRGGTNG